MLAERSNYSEYLNKEYSPSQWSKRFLDGIDVVAVHIGITTEGTISIFPNCNFKLISLTSRK